MHEQTNKLPERLYAVGGADGDLHLWYGNATISDDKESVARLNKNVFDVEGDEFIIEATLEEMRDLVRRRGLQPSVWKLGRLMKRVRPPWRNTYSTNSTTNRPGSYGAPAFISA